MNDATHDGSRREESTRPPVDRSDDLPVLTRFLVVDHDRARAEIIRRDLQPFASIVAPSISVARELLSAGGIVGVVTHERPAGVCALALIEPLRERHDRIPVLVLLHLGDVGATNRFHLHGAPAVEAVRSGPNVRSFAREATHEPDAQDVEDAVLTFGAMHRLTARHRDTVTASISLPNHAAVAEKLKISRRTVEKHFEAIYARTGINKRQLVIDAVLHIARRRRT
jgi:FixJ family two-component response regulator